MTVIQELAKWAHGFDAWSPASAETARRCLEDVFACQIAGLREPAASRTRDALGPWMMGGRAHVLGGQAALAPFAALANGVAAHALDYDDLSVEAANHPSAVLVPALLALAEETGKSGREVQRAFIVGLELNYRLAAGVMKSHATAGWHTTSTLGCIAAAGACARLLGLPAVRIAHALSLGVSHACGIKGQIGSHAKPLHAGIAAQHGIQAAMLAAAGVEGRLDILECETGFRALFGGGETPGWPTPYSMEGESLLLDRFGIAIKRFPSCGAMHRSLDCLLELRSEHGFAADDVASIDATVGLLNYRNLRYSNPQTSNEAKFSIHYCMSVALLEGGLTLADFSEVALRRPEVRSLMDKVRLSHHPQERNSTLSSEAPPHEVVVTLKNGERHARARSHAVGTAAHPLSEADRVSKFIECSAGHMSRDAALALRERLNAIEDCTDVPALMAFFNDALIHA